MNGDLLLDWISQNSRKLTQNGNTFVAKGAGGGTLFNPVLPTDGNGNVNVNSNTSYIAYYHGKYDNSDIHYNHVNRIDASYVQNNKNVWISPESWISANNFSNEYFVGENSLFENCNIPPEKIVFSGSSYGGQFMLRDFSNTIDHNSKKCVLFEPTPSKYPQYKPTQAEIDRIRNSGATMFLVDSGHNGDYSSNVYLPQMADEGSNVRLFHINMNMTQPNKYKNHHYCLEGGVSYDFGLMDLLTGDPSKFNEVVNLIDSGNYIDIPGHPLPLFELYYKGKKIQFNTARDFYNYYLAVDNYENVTDISTKIEYLDILYTVESLAGIYDSCITNSPEVVNTSMTSFRNIINCFDELSAASLLSNPIGLEDIVTEVVNNYNEKVNEFRVTMDKLIKLGVKINNAYKDTEKSLNEDVSSI